MNATEDFLEIGSVHGPFPSGWERRGGTGGGEEREGRGGRERGEGKEEGRGRKRGMRRRKGTRGEKGGDGRREIERRE